jgi:hypothetical protein
MSKAKGETYIYMVELTKRDSAQFLNALAKAAEDNELQDPFEVQRVLSFDKVILAGETR